MGLLNRSEPSNISYFSRFLSLLPPGQLKWSQYCCSAWPSQKNRYIEIVCAYSKRSWLFDDFWQIFWHILSCGARWPEWWATVSAPTLGSLSSFSIQYPRRSFGLLLFWRFHSNEQSWQNGIKVSPCTIWPQTKPFAICFHGIAGTCWLIPDRQTLMNFGWYVCRIKKQGFKTCRLSLQFNSKYFVEEWLLENLVLYLRFLTRIVYLRFWWSRFPNKSSHFFLIKLTRMKPHCIWVNIGVEYLAIIALYKWDLTTMKIGDSKVLEKLVKILSTIFSNLDLFTTARTGSMHLISYPQSDYGLMWHLNTRCSFYSFLSDSLSTSLRAIFPLIQLRLYPASTHFTNDEGTSLPI